MLPPSSVSQFNSWGKILREDHLRLPDLGLSYADNSAPCPPISGLASTFQGLRTAGVYGREAGALVPAGGPAHSWVCPGPRWADGGVLLGLATFSSMKSAAVLRYRGGFLCFKVETESFRRYWTKDTHWLSSGMLGLRAPPCLPS